mgnify:CR=1 FL=1
MKKLHYPRICFVVFIIAGFVLLFINLPRVYGQTQPVTPYLTQTFAETPTLTTTPTLTATLTFQQQTDGLLITYKEVLDTSKRTIDEVHTTANGVLDFVKTMFIALTIGGLGGAGLLSWFGQRASDKANTAQQKALEALDIIQKTETKTAELEKRNNLVLNTTVDLSQRQDNLLLQINEAERLFKSLQNELAQLKNSGERDRQVIKKPLALVQIDEYAMQALSDEPEEKNSSILSLIEMSRRNDAKPDAVIRRKAVKVFGILEEYDERVVKRLKEIIEEDPAQGVRKEAQKSLKLIELNKKNNGLTS